ncbi:MAG: efflux RND transporter periplasmic adaptor subunit [Nitrospirae bacterium]|nr:efflux RND transporter periplasmic adaptor subunit [Nitrospirota bacterium]
MRRTFLVSIIFFIAVLSFAALNFSCKKKEIKAPAERSVNVQAQAVEVKRIRPFIMTIGTLNPYEEVILSAEVDGVLKDVRVDEGTIVSKGMVLAVIDDTDYRLEAKRAKAAMSQAEASLNNTRVEFGRKQSLFKEELVTRQQFDDVSTRLSVAEADLERAAAALALAGERLKKTLIYSPLSGYIKEKKVSSGSYVRNGSNLFSIIQNNPIKLNFTVTEKEVGKLRTGQDVVFKIDAFPEKEFKGRVNIIYPSLEEKTRSLKVEAITPNPNGLLKPGLFARVILYTGAEKEAMLAPIISLLYEGDKVKVFAIDGERAKERAVKVGQKQGEMIEITEGLRAGEEVVVVGQQNLSDGAKVSVAR